MRAPRGAPAWRTGLGITPARSRLGEALGPPAAKARAPHVEPVRARRPPEPPAASGHTVLVVEDNPINMRMLVLLVERRGHTVAVTAHAMVGGRDKCLQPGMDGFLTKRCARRRSTACWRTGWRGGSPRPRGPSSSTR